MTLKMNHSNFTINCQQRPVPTFELSHVEFHFRATACANRHPATASHVLYYNVPRPSPLPVPPHYDRSSSGCRRARPLYHYSQIREGKVCCIWLSSLALPTGQGGPITTLPLRAFGACDVSSLPTRSTRSPTPRNIQLVTGIRRSSVVGPGGTSAPQHHQNINPASYCPRPNLFISTYMSSVPSCSAMVGHNILPEKRHVVQW